MAIPKYLLLTLCCILMMNASKCDEGVSKKTLRKIDFDYSTINQKGMMDSAVAVDYEFCIPRDDAKIAEVKAIEPNVNMPRMAKGRIGCSDEEYLCIVTTKGTDWKEKLYAIASLPYVKRIIQTYYE